MYKSVRMLEGVHITATEKRNFLFVVNQNNPEYFNKKIKVNRMVFEITPLDNNLFKLVKYENRFSVLLNRNYESKSIYKLEVIK